MRTLFCFFALGCGAKLPPALSTHDIQPCPSSPNCVSTQADPEDSHFIASIAIEGDRPAFWAHLDEVVQALPRAELLIDEPDYRHYVFTTAVMRFKDDVQFELDPGSDTLHFRSASRLGKSDLGVNRRRMERIRDGMTGL